MKLHSLYDFGSVDAPAKTISPLLELGAYELLWLKYGATFKTIADLFRAAPDALPSELVDIEQALETATKVLATLKAEGINKFGIRIHRAGEYPEKLRDARHPVELLYYQGIWELVELPSIAIVGTRNPSQGAIEETTALVRHLIEADWTIVSGLATGIDTAAHTSAMKLGKPTIAVIGTLLCEVYPRNNVRLQQNIAENFLLISQIPVLRYHSQSWKQNRLFFPERNVTMSALTAATVIVEAGETSGTLIQARAALHQGRKLFILDRCFRNPDLKWPQQYADKGAIRIKDYSQITKVLRVADKGRRPNTD